jgi:integrase
MAYIEQRKKGWRAQVRRKGAPSLSRTFDLKTDAEAWAIEIERELRRGNIAALRQDAQRTTISEVLKSYKAAAPATLALYLSRIDARFGSYFLANVRGVDIAAWRDDLAASGLSAQTVIHHVNAFSALFSFVEKDLSIDLPAGNPVRKVRKPSQPKARERRLRAGELEMLLRSAAAPGAAQGLAQIIVLAVETSMRLGELIGLEWSRIDLEQRTAHLVDTKNGESRTVALSTTAIEALTALPRRIDGRVFRWKTVSGFESIWQRCLARARRTYLLAQLAEQLNSEGSDGAGEVRALVYHKREPAPRTRALLAKLEASNKFLVDLRFHDLRHEATSRLFEKGLGIMEVASMTGHKSLAMLKRYTHVEAARLAQKLG